MEAAAAEAGGMGGCSPFAKSLSSMAWGPRTQIVPKPVLRVSLPFTSHQEQTARSHQDAAAQSTDTDAVYAQPRPLPMVSSAPLTKIKVDNKACSGIPCPAQHPRQEPEEGRDGRKQACQTTESNR